MGDCEGGQLHRVTWIYSLSHADLKRLIPRLAAPAITVASPDALVAEYPDGRRLRVELEPETERRLGSIRLRGTCFTFVFEGWSNAGIEAFLVHCTRGLQQGGG